MYDTCEATQCYRGYISYGVPLLSHMFLLHPHPPPVRCMVFNLLLQSKIPATHYFTCRVIPRQVCTTDVPGHLTSRSAIHLTPYHDFEDIHSYNPANNAFYVLFTVRKQKTRNRVRTRATVEVHHFPPEASSSWELKTSQNLIRRKTILL